MVRYCNDNDVWAVNSKYQSVWKNSQIVTPIAQVCKRRSKWQISYTFDAELDRSEKPRTETRALLIVSFGSEKHLPSSLR